MILQRQEYIYWFLEASTFAAQQDYNVAPSALRLTHMHGRGMGSVRWSGSVFCSMTQRVLVHLNEGKPKGIPHYGGELNVGGLL